jgi:hypothetical protein
MNIIQDISMRRNIQLLILLLIFMGCQEKEIYFPDGEILPDGKVRVALNLNLPHPLEVTTRTNSNIDQVEKRVARLCVALFEGEEIVTPGVNPVIKPNAKLLQLIIGDDAIIGDGHAHVILDQYDKPYHMQAFVNYSSRFGDKLSELRPGVGNDKTYADFILLTEDITSLYLGGDATAGQLKSADNTTNLALPLPMSSTINYSNEPIGDLTALTLDLKHIYARITVNAVNVENSNYELVNAQLLAGINIASYNQDFTPIASDPIIKYIEYQVTNAVDKIPSDLANHVSPIYLFPNNTNDVHTDIVVGGKYTDEQGKTHLGYHKIRIQYTNHLKELNHAIYRNMIYNINILSVKSAGYRTFEQAKNSQPTNTELDYVIDVSDGVSQDFVVNNGAYYMGFSNSELIIYDDKALQDVTATTLFYALNTEITNPAALPVMTPTDVTVTGGIVLKNTSYHPNVKNDIIIDLDKKFTAGSISFHLGNLAHKVNIERRKTLPPLQQFVTNEIKSSFFDFASTDYVYAKFIQKPEWIYFSENLTANSIESDNGIALALTNNMTQSKRVSPSLYLFRKNNKGTVKVHIAQDIFLPPSNCYMAKPGESVRFYANLIGRSTVKNTALYDPARPVYGVQSIIGDHVYTSITPKTVELKWQTAHGRVEQSENPIMLIEENTIQFDPKTYECLIPITHPEGSNLGGSALICAKDINGNIIWSWHIWVTPDDVLDVEVGSNEMMQDRALGALKNEKGVHSFGMQYQWGRKDLFTPSNSLDDIEIQIYMADSTPIRKGRNGMDGEFTISGAPAHKVDELIRKPSAFFGANGTPFYPIPKPIDTGGDWWNPNVKTLYDPCPPFYKVPGLNAYTDFPNPHSWSPDLNNGIYWKGVFFSTGGLRTYYSGDLVNSGYYGAYWVSTPRADTSAYALLFYSGYFTSVSSKVDRSNAYSVRCVREG